jgi:hypothetical protein
MAGRFIDVKPLLSKETELTPRGLTTVPDLQNVKIAGLLEQAQQKEKRISEKSKSDKLNEIYTAIDTKLFGGQLPFGSSEADAAKYLQDLKTELAKIRSEAELTREKIKTTTDYQKEQEKILRDIYTKKWYEDLGIAYSDAEKQYRKQAEQTLLQEAYTQQQASYYESMASLLSQVGQAKETLTKVEIQYPDLKAPEYPTPKVEDKGGFFQSNWVKVAGLAIAGLVIFGVVAKKAR